MNTAWTILATFIGACVLIGLLLVTLSVTLWVVGSGVETYAQHREERDRCLKRATNGYEIQQCR